MLQEAGHIKNKVVLVFRHIQCLHLMNSEIAWVLVSSGTQVQPQIILNPDYIPDYLSVSYNYSEYIKVLWRSTFLFSRQRLFNFLNFMKTSPNMTNATLTEA